MLATLDAWSYKIAGQQVSAVLDDTSAGSISVVDNNAASSRTSGAEAKIDWTTPVPGLQLRGSLTYMDAHYVLFNTASCYTGQTPAKGCNLDPLNGVYQAQDLSGRKLPRSPDWVETMGASYSKLDGAGHRYTFSVDATHSAGYMADNTNNPVGVQKAFWLVDASVRFETRSGLELAVIGKNLTKTYYYADLVNEPLTGGGTGTPGGFPGDEQGGVSRGREIVLRASIKFGAGR